MTRVAWVAVLPLLGLGCGDPPALDVPFRVEVLPGAVDPTADAVESCVVVEGPDGDVVQERCDVLGTPATYPSLSGLPFGRGLRLRVETFTAGGRGTVVGRGRSYRFDVDADGVIGSADVTLGVVGTFAPVVEDVPWELPPVSVTAAPGGALIAFSDGGVWRYDAHPEDPQADRFRPVSTSPERAGAEYAAFSDGFLLAVGGVDAGATLFDADGRVATILDNPVLEAHRHGATVVIAPGSTDALVYGGSETLGGEPVGFATRIRRLEGSGLRAVIEDPLRLPRKDADAAVLTDIGDQAQPISVALLLGGSAPEEVVVVDPVTNVPAPRRFLLEPPPVPAEANVGVLARDLALVVGGGPDPGDPAAGTLARVLAVDPTDGRPREVATLVPFAEARRRPAVATFGDGLALVTGGLGAAEVPVADAQVIFAGRFSIDVEDTGSPPIALGAPRAAAMGDGTVLVVDPEAALLWFPSRQR